MSILCPENINLSILLCLDKEFVENSRDGILCKHPLAFDPVLIDGIDLDGSVATCHILLMRMKVLFGNISNLYDPTIFCDNRIETVFGIRTQ